MVSMVLNLGSPSEELWGALKENPCPGWPQSQRFYLTDSGEGPSNGIFIKALKVILVCNQGWEPPDGNFQVLGKCRTPASSEESLLSV